MSKERKLAYLALLASTFIWGAALPLAKPAFDFINPLQYLTLRFILATMVMSPFILRLFIKKTIPASLIALIFIIEGIGYIALYLTYVGLEMVTALQASLILNTSPIFITIAGIIFLHEHEEPHEWAGLAISVIGTFVIFLSPLLYSSSPTQAQTSYLGTGLILLSLIIGTLYVIAIKKVYKPLDKPSILAILSLSGMIIFTTISILTQTPIAWSSLSQPSVLTAVIYMAILGTPIASGLSQYGYLHIEISEATLFAYLRPLVYIPLTVIWLGEVVTPVQIIGLITVIFGVYIAERRTSKVSLYSKVVKFLNKPHHHPHHHLHQQ